MRACGIEGTTPQTTSGQRALRHLLQAKMAMTPPLLTMAARLDGFLLHYSERLCLRRPCVDEDVSAQLTSPRRVLTAGRCLQHEEQDAAVLGGFLSLQIRQIASTVVHPHIVTLELTMRLAALHASFGIRLPDACCSNIPLA